MKKGQQSKRAKFWGSIGLAAAILMSGCQKSSPVGGEVNEATRSSDELTFVESQQNVFAKQFQTQQFVSAANGGTVTVGDDSSGYCYIVFKPGDLPQDSNIGFQWNSNTFEADFAPHGIQFNQPVEVVFSYKGANLNNIAENDLTIWYYNEVNNNYEYIGGQVNLSQKLVRGYLNHFSRYTLASDED